MTFKDIAIKNFKGSIRKYLVYFLGNSFIVASYFIFVNMYDNGISLSGKIEEGVFEGFTIPIVALTIFTIVFISYSHMTFIHQRKKEFGIFMNLGMSISNIRKLIIIENFIIAGASIIAGLVVGIVFSRFMYLILLKVIEVNYVEFSLSIKSFGVSIGIFLLLNFSSLIATIIGTYKFKIINLLKSKNRVMGRNKDNVLIFVLGVVFFSIAIFLLFKGTNENSIYGNYYVVLGLILIYLGLYLIISNLGSFLLRLIKKNKKRYYKNLIWITQVDSKFKENRYIILITAILVSISIVYSGTTLKTYTTSESLAIDNNTYDITFFQVENKNEISKQKIDELISKSDVEVNKYIEVEILYYRGTRENRGYDILISENELREKFKEDIDVSKGTYKRLNQFVEEKSDEKSLVAMSINLILDNRVKAISYDETIFKKLFRTENNGFNNIVILDSEDYKSILSNTSIYWLGKIKILNTTNWKNSISLVNSLKDELSKGNTGTEFYDIGLDMEEVLKVRSKIGSFRYNKQGYGFILFTCGYLGVFFFCAISVILFLKLMADAQEDKERYRSMYLIGIGDKEVKKIISKELRPIYFLGLVFGGAIGVVLTLCLIGTSDISILRGFIKADIIMIGVYFVIQILYYMYSKNKYFNYLK